MKTVTIPSHCFLAIMDRELRAKGFKPVYMWNVYFDTMKRKKEAGILLHSFEGFVPFDAKQREQIGILGFVNGQEPGEGSIPLHEIVPKPNDSLSLAYVIQGVYKGDFFQATVVGGKALKGEKHIEGLHLVHHYQMTEKDLIEQAYEISLLSDSILSRE